MRSDCPNYRRDIGACTAINCGCDALAGSLTERTKKRLDRYGKARVSKIRAAFNDLRKAIRSGDIEAAEVALDRYEPWADYVFDGRHADG